MDINSKMDEVAASLLAKIEKGERVFKGNVAYKLDDLKESLRNNKGRALGLVLSDESLEKMIITDHPGGGGFEIIPTLSELLPDERDREAYIESEEAAAKIAQEKNEQSIRQDQEQRRGGLR